MLGGKRLYIIILVIFSIISIIYTWPIFQNINNIGILDWDATSLFYEIIRSSIINYHQIPLWSPYHCGGNFIFAHPMTTLISSQFILILLFGTIIGSKIGVLLHLIIGLFGMFLLSRHIKLGIFSSFLSAFIFLLSSQYALQLSIGNIGYFGIVLLPYIFLFYLKSFKNIQFIIPTVLALTLMAFISASYEFIIVLLFLFIYSLSKLFLQKDTKVIKIFILIMILTFLLGSIKFLPILDVIKENPNRIEIYSETNNIKTFFTALLNRNQAEINNNDIYSAYITPIEARPLPPWHDYGMYIGIIPLILIFLGLFSKFKEKWVLFATSIIFLILYFGEASPFNLWKILNLFPIFNSLRIISRFHLVFIFTFSILAGMGLSLLELNKKRVIKIITFFIVLFVLFDLILVNSSIFKDAFTNTIEISKDNNSFHQILNNYSYNNYSESAMYIAYLKNEGTLNCHDTFYIASAVSAIDHKSKLYKGEFYLKNGNGNISLIYFSPNKIKLHLNVSEDDLLIINQNYHKGWKIKEKEVKPYYGLISTEVRKGEYDLTFYYLPNIFLIGSIFSILTIILLIYLYKNPKELNYRLIIILSLIIILLISSIYLQENIKKDAPEIYEKLIGGKEDYSIINIPYLFDQGDTISLIKKQPGLYFLRSPSKFNNDIIKQSFKSNRAILNYYNLEWIILHKQFLRYNLLYDQKYEYDPYWAREKDFAKEIKNLIEENLKINNYHEDEDVIIYKIEKFKPETILLFEDGWHKVEYWDSEPVRWTEDRAFIKIINPEKKIINFSFNVSNFYEPKTLKIYLNSKLINNYEIKDWTEIKISLNINAGENILELYTKEKCLKPNKVTKSADTRCLSLAIKNLEYI